MESALIFFNYTTLENFRYSDYSNTIPSNLPIINLNLWLIHIDKWFNWNSTHISISTCYYCLYICYICATYVQSLSDPTNYHEFCRLLLRLKSNYQLGELVMVQEYAATVELIAKFTVDSLSTWQFAPNSVHYLLSLWQRMVGSVPYMKVSGLNWTFFEWSGKLERCENQFYPLIVVYVCFCALHEGECSLPHMWPRRS